MRVCSVGCSLLVVRANSPAFHDRLLFIQEKPFYTQNIHLSTFCFVFLFFLACRMRAEAKSWINRDNLCQQQSIDLHWRAPPVGTFRYFTVGAETYILSCRPSLCSPLTSSHLPPPLLLAGSWTHAACGIVQR